MTTLREAAKQVQEPVAWVYASIAGQVVLHIVKSVGVAKASFVQSKLDIDMQVAKEYPNAHSCTPLYTTPPASVSEAPQRKPLTEEEIEKAYREIWRNLPTDFDHTSSGWIEQGIKYAERAHGIGETK